MKKYDYLVVGSGLFGSTFANLAKKDGKKVCFIGSIQNKSEDFEKNDSMRKLYIKSFTYLHYFEIDYRAFLHYLDSFRILY